MKSTNPTPINMKSLRWVADLKIYFSSAII
jgi:hypothetical protein